MTADRQHPQLPQHATPSDQRARARAVADARETWTWTTAVPTLPGVPLAADVPFADKPDIPWLILVAEVGLAVARNALANKRADTEEDVTARMGRLDEIEASVAAIRAHHEGASAPITGLRGVLDLAAGAVGTLLGTHDATLRGYLDELQALVDHAGLGVAAKEDIAAFKDLFRTLPLPQVANTFTEDATFARMRVAGPNASLIEGISALPSNFALTDEAYGAVVGGDTLRAAGAEGRLYLADYRELGGMVAGVSEGKQKYLWLPLALFAVPPGGRSLVPVAIQTGQDPASSSVFVAPAPGVRDWAWEMAKFTVQVADGNYHELFAHLARTHLVLEAFAVANRRALAPQHPLSLLLIAHTEGTLFINNAAAGGLIAAGGPIERIFAGTIDTIQLAAANDRLAFDFSARMLPRDLARRAVTDTEALPDYPYRDDALLVWGAIERWIRAYVRTYYAGDHDVIGDTELAAFVAEVRGAGLVRGFGALETVDALVDALTMIVFTASAQHAAVNFPQQTDMSFAPNVTGSGWAPFPSGGEPSEARWIGMMPTTSLALDQLNTLWLLGGVHFRQLGAYLSGDFPYKPWFEDPQVTRSGGPLEAFRNDLRDVTAQIERNNTGRAVPYAYLLPAQIPESINI